MEQPCISQSELADALALRDLTDSAGGPHALQHLVEDACIALRNAHRCHVVLHRGARIVSAADSYDSLRYPPEGGPGGTPCARWIDAEHLLRTHMTVTIPPLLRAQSNAPARDTLLACPGVVYRRACIDEWHTGEPHQLELWRIRDGHPLGEESREYMIAHVLGTLVPGMPYRTLATEHPHTVASVELQVRYSERWIAVGGCGLAHPDVLSACGLRRGATGLAMRLGLDRLLMVRKGIEDIRLLRSDDPRVETQMRDLAPFRPVSKEAASRKDLSPAVAAGSPAPREMPAARSGVLSAKTPAAGREGQRAGCQQE